MAQDPAMIDDDIDESLWDSPAKAGPGSVPTPSAASKQSTAGAKPTYMEQQAREASLRQELESVRAVNEAIEGVIHSLGKAKDNMKTVNNTVGAASTLLQTWTRILSQTEHNQRLILDPSWHGATQDVADMETEALERQRAAQRRDAEEQERKSAAAARRAEEEERRKAESVGKPVKSTRGIGRGTASSRGSSTASTSYVQMGGSANTSTSSIKRAPSSSRRPASGIGRGIGGRGTRGRG